MSDGNKPCLKCERPIDRWAKLCVYCNWDQSQAYVPPPPSNIPPSYTPPPDNRARNRMLTIGSLVALIIFAFVFGTWYHGFEPKELKNAEVAQTTTAPAGLPQRSNVTLVPATEGAPASYIEQPLTSAPPQAPGQDASDATALPSDQYAAVAAKAKAQKAAKTNAPVDPREVRGQAVEEAPAAPMASSSQPTAAPTSAERVTRTEAYPEYKPMPAIHVDRETTARLVLTVGADGRVKDINIIDPIPGGTAKVIEAVQTWRFRPATENGTPVNARVPVTIILHSNG